MVGDGSSYNLSTKETVMAGMPRYDRLNDLDANSTATRSSTITIMPTWRKQLDDELSSITDPETRFEAFRQSQWWSQWSLLLNSPSLRETAVANSMSIRFVPHPRLESFIPPNALPDYVDVAHHSSNDFQSMLVEASVLVTDLSSVAFDAAFIDRPVVYFQFDTESIYGGGHTTKPGYFSFENDGFGPVVSTVAEAVDAIGSLISGDDPRIAEFAERRKATFTLPKTGNCERTYKAIVRSLKLVSPKDGTTLRPSPTAQPTRYLDEPSRPDSSLKSEPVAHTAAERESTPDVVLRATTGLVKPTADEDPAKTAPAG
ncbi:CDP-glycerol glycerophosphotransferase family protein [Brevibacterium casei]